MSLERTRKSIANLEKKQHITTAQMFDVITRLVKETFEHNGAEDISQMAQGSREDLIIYAYALSEILLSTVKQNQDTIQEQEDSAELQNVFSQIEQVRADLSEKIQEIKNLQSRKNMLSEEKQRLEQKNDEREKLKEECEALQIKITAEKAAAEKTEKEKLQKQLEYDNILAKKKELEEKVQYYKQQKAECDAWILKYETEHAKIMQNCEEYAAKYAQIYTAINSIFREQYLKEHLYAMTDNGAELTPDNYPEIALFPERIDSLDTFQIWQDAMQTRIEGLLTVYQEALQKLAECTSRMTADR